MSQPTPHYEPGEQQPEQGDQRGYYASAQAYPQYEGQPQPHPPTAGYGQQSHPAQPQYAQPQAVPGQPSYAQPQYGQPQPPRHPDHSQSPGYSRSNQNPWQQAAPQPGSGQPQAMPQIGYPPPPYFRQQPVPAARSRNGLIIGIVAGAVALVLLVCVGVGYFVIKSIPNKSTSPLAHSPSNAQTPPTRPQIYSNTLQAARFHLQVEINPAKTGDNVVHLYAFTPTGRQLKVDEWKVTASLPLAGIDQVNMPVLKLTENHAVGTISLPAHGQWQFQFTLRTSELDQDSVTAQVPIK